MTALALLAPTAASAAAVQDADGALLLWLVVLCAALLAACAAALWLLVARTRELATLNERASALEKIHTQLARLVGERSDIDLRRIQHVLIDVRDGLAKVEGALLDVLQGGVPTAGGGEGRGAPGVSERVVNRLLALGYERVELTGGDEGPEADVPLEEGSERIHELRVEAQRRGVLYKGKVVLEGGRIHDVEMSPTYSTFP